MFNRFKIEPYGQSLLELIFAMAVLLVVAVALLAATSAGISGQKASEFLVISNNLARESIEVVRSLRDGNWLSGQPWDQGLESAEDYITVFDPLGPAKPTPVPAWQLTSGDSQLFLENGIYTHQPVNIFTAEPTVYNRTIDIDSICQNTSGVETISADCGLDTRIGIQVRAEVAWVDKGRARSVIITDLLYAWR